MEKDGERKVIIKFIKGPVHSISGIINSFIVNFYGKNHCSGPRYSKFWVERLAIAGLKSVSLPWFGPPCSFYQEKLFNLCNWMYLFTIKVASRIIFKKINLLHDFVLLTFFAWGEWGIRFTFKPALIPSISFFGNKIWWLENFVNLKFRRKYFK